MFSIYLLYTMNANEINPSVVSTRTWGMQLAAAVLGIISALVLAAVNYRFLSKIWWIYAPIALGLSLLLFTSLGKRTGSATDLNWLDLGFVEIQPSEFLKVAFIMTFATHLHRVGENMNRPHHMMLLCLHGMIPIGLVLIQDDTGTATIIALMFVTMLFAAGLSWRYILAGTVGIPALLYVFWEYYAKAHHKIRILVLIDEEIRNQEWIGAFDQQRRGLIALSSGGLTGLGVSGGDYTHIYAIHNDFIFAYIGMVLGFVGCVLTLLVLLLISIKLMTVATTARDSLGRIICCGVFAMVFFHSVINVGMVIAVTPVVGVPLPFISAGGSSMLALFFAIGLVLSVRAHREKKYHMFYEED